MTNQTHRVYCDFEVASVDGFDLRLTRRQREVLELLCEGLPNKLISRRLCVSDATVKTHVASVLRSMNVSTRLEAATVAFKLGLVRNARSESRRGDGDPPQAPPSHGAAAPVTV